MKQRGAARDPGGERFKMAPILNDESCEGHAAGFALLQPHVAKVDTEVQ